VFTCPADNLAANKRTTPIKTKTALCTFMFPPKLRFRGASDARSAHWLRQFLFQRPLASLLSSAMRRYMCLGLRSRLANPLFVTRFEDRAAIWIAFVKYFRQEIAVSIFVENQFG